MDPFFLVDDSGALPIWFIFRFSFASGPMRIDLGPDPPWFCLRFNSFASLAMVTVRALVMSLITYLCSIIGSKSRA